MSRSNIVTLSITCLLLAHIILHIILNNIVNKSETQKDVLIKRLNKTNALINQLSKEVSKLKIEAKLSRIDSFAQKFSAKPISQLNNPARITKRRIKINSVETTSIAEHLSVLYSRHMLEDYCFSFSKITCIKDCMLSANIKDGKEIVGANMKLTLKNKQTNKEITVNFRSTSDTLRNNVVIINLDEKAGNNAGPDNFGPLAYRKADRSARFIGFFSSGSSITGTLSWYEISDDQERFFPVEFDLTLASH